MKQLVVNADDFGRSAAINRGIVEAYEHGIVTSASLMVRWPAAREAANYARAYPGLGLGLHLDLGEWRHTGDTWVPAYEVVDPSDESEVRAELERQLAELRRLVGRDPTHLDSHQHVHLHEPARGAVVTAARRLDLPVRRVSPHIRFRGEFYGQGDRGEPFPAGIATETLLSLVAGLDEGVTELACHPGLGEAESQYGSERDRETAALCDGRVRAAIEQEGVELRSFAGLAFEHAD